MLSHLLSLTSHGTSEFYRARAAITKRLIQQHGFNMVAIEGDWPDARIIDRYVRKQPSPHSLKPDPIFQHFPRWMWRNTELQSFVDWMEQHNAALAPDQRTGFYGLDLYSLGASIRAVIDYLDRNDPESAVTARARYACLEPWVDDPAKYGRVALNKGYAPCEAGAVAMLRDLLKKRLSLTENDGSEEFLNAEINARVVRDAERYYRAMYYGGAESWNLRDDHMFNTLAILLKSKPGAKAVVWAHNSHVGDARYTDMTAKDELNIGQLCRQTFSKPGEVSIIGMSTHNGVVAAAREWDTAEQHTPINPSRSDSYERVMHDTGIPSFTLDLRAQQENEELRQALMKPRLERFIGVIYRPDTEFWSHYMKAVLPKQFDALVWFDRTSAVTPFERVQPREALSVEETYPFGL
jgi:erythromycin esterase-like protein